MTLKRNTAVFSWIYLFTSCVKLDNILVGRYLSLEDNIFVENVVADIQHFVTKGEENRQSVLIFPPVNNYRRFLIHKVCEESVCKNLSTFSVGQGINRRTVLCFKSLVRKPSILEVTHDQTPQQLGLQTSTSMVVERKTISPENLSPEHNCNNGNIKRVRAAPAIYRPPAARKLEALNLQIKCNANDSTTSISPPITSVTSKSERTRSGNRQRRPDIQVYVPRAKRASLVDQSASQQHSCHSENVSADQPSSASKKNSSDHPSKDENISVNYNFSKSCHISTPVLKDVDCNVAPDSVKMDVDCMRSVLDIVKSSGKEIVGSEENVNFECSESFISVEKEKCDQIPALNLDEQNDIDTSKNEVYVKCSGEVEEIKELSESCGNGCVDTACDSKNNNNIHCESNNSVPCDVDGQFEEKQTGDVHYQKLSTQDYESSSEVEGCTDSVLDNLNQEKSVLQPDTSDVKIPDTNNVAGCGNEVFSKCSISDVLTISDPKTPSYHEVAKPKDPEDVNKDSSIPKKVKGKHKSRSNNAEKNGNVSTTPANKNTIPVTTITTTTIATTKPNTINTTTKATKTDTSSSATSVVSLNPDECTWDMLFDDNGDCLDPKIIEELTSAVGSVTIEKPQSDYNRFISRTEINLPGGDEEFAHVIEIYNFPSEFKTQDLMTAFSPYKNCGFEIKWVDDTHALGVFSSSRVAAEVLSCEHPFVKTRPLSEATPESRSKARRAAEFLQPYKTRPETCVAMARRLVTGALGMKLTASKEEREAERRLLKEAREKKRLAAQQVQDAWEGIIR